MTARLHTGLPLLAALLGFAYSPLAVAETDEPRWYQVELIAFARNHDDSGEEHWPRDIQLGYPLDWVSLSEPDELARERTERAAARRALDEQRRALSFPVPWEEEPEEEPLAEPTVDLLREPFLQLPAPDRELNAHANALRRDGAYRVLFHEAWRQPGLPRGQGPWLLVRGGESFGDHYELEGSVQISLARYLHLNTRLWLTEFAGSGGAGPGEWPELPPWPEDAQAMETTTGEFRTREMDFSLNTQAFWEEGRRSQLPAYLANPYQPTRIATLEQSRRMRSDELHYVDHPLMGLVLRITRYKVPPKELDTELLELE